ncbi:hypothetical protein [Taklimakanibacter lacteus]|uniref:hypothetical protein n=1 Tax=Taklimakanibacter lacteus TaxID=2268456 RepID=UPI000E675590
MPTPASLDLVHQMRRILTSAQLDCQCRATLDVALNRFSDIQCRERLRESLCNARRQRDWISGRLPYLADLDEISEHECDRTIFEELALMFDEIGAAAAEAARAIREAQREIATGM